MKNVLEDLLACVTAMGGSGEGIADMRRALVDTVSDTGELKSDRFVNVIASQIKEHLAFRAQNHQ